jgi:drug/metabolite transporter (DMT)-like permease
VLSVVITLPQTIASFAMPTLDTALALVGVGVLGAAGQLLMTWAYAHGEAARLAVIGSLGAVLGAGWDLALWGHAPDLMTAAGGVMVIGTSAALQVIRRAGPDAGVAASR